jgi:uncharacterized membrane protein YgcG/anti-sigma regulatory factor (Ser/Thr protein kinase)
VAFEVIPSAKRLITSLRDIGYDFAQAVADIVDNSVEAGATLVAIDVEFDGDDSWVRIVDNGKGMSPKELREAMRYGSERTYDDEADLGKFGLGLKTASMSQCQRLSVASRQSKKKAAITGYSWDLGHISRTNKWEILALGNGGLSRMIRQPLKKSKGTVVFWERLDRILGYKHPYSEHARKRLSQMCRSLEVHLGMVFHNFLIGKARRKRLKILLNGIEIKPWDPFCRDESKTKALDSLCFPLEHEGVSGEVIITPYILPHQSDFSSPDAFRLASGPAKWNRQQGFYIYRSNRMIQSGGWSRLRAPDEHTKLARFAVFFSPSLDDAFKINVAKMRVQLPVEIRTDIVDAIAPIIKKARNIYDRKDKGNEGGSGTSSGGGSSSGGSSAGGASGSGKRKGESAELLTIERWNKRLLKVANPSERPVVKAVIKRMK